MHSRPNGSDSNTSDAAGRNIVVISGPGGAGKGTIVAKLMEFESEIPMVLSRSWTTRARRPGESDDAYCFVSADAFKDRIAAGGFLEWAEFLGNMYGTPSPDPESDAVLILEIDVQGARQVVSRFPGALLIFVDAPSRQHQKQRLRQRGDDEQHVAMRLAKADQEVESAAELGAVVVVNDSVDRASAQIESLIRSHRRHR